MIKTAMKQPECRKLWELVGEERPITYGILKPGPDTEDGVPYVRVVDMQDGAVLVHQIRRTTDVIARQYARSTLKEGDILLSIRGHVGRVAMVPKSLEGANITQDTARIAVNGSCCPRYLFWFLQSPEVQQRMQRHTKGVAVKGINLGDVKELDVPLPPKTTQARIAAILDKADTIRRKREEGIRLTEALLRSTFQEVFGDPATNPKGWKTVTVEDGLSRERPGMRCGPFGTALRKQEYVAEGIPVWGIENIQPNLFLEAGSLFITEDKYSELSAYRVLPGDVLISRAGTVGRMCVARPRQEHSIIGTNLIRVVLDQSVITPDYFTALFTYFADRVAGLRASSDDGAYSFMQTGVLRHVRVPLPPIEKQQAYAKFVQLTRRNQTRRKEGLEGAEVLFRSLVQRAFRGEL